MFKIIKYNQCAYKFKYFRIDIDFRTIFVRTTTRRDASLRWPLLFAKLHIASKSIFFSGCFVRTAQRKKNHSTQKRMIFNLKQIKLVIIDEHHRAPFLPPGKRFTYTTMVAEDVEKKIAQSATIQSRLKMLVCARYKIIIN